MDGEIVCLLGHNGAGKTTLIKCLASLLYPSEGTIEYNGINIYSNIKEYRTKTSYLLGGKKGLYNRLSGRDNVEYIAALKGIFGDNLQSDIEKYFDELGILKFIDERVENYSRGMKQKVHLINSLITDSQVIFLDEPTSGMDSIAAKQTREFIKTIAKKDNKTIFVTSHMMNEVEDISDRIIILFKGNKEFDGNINYFKDSLTNNVECDCKLRNSNECIDIINSWSGSHQYTLLPYNYNDDEIELRLIGKSSSEIMDNYIKHISDYIMYINFEKPSLETVYINYIQDLERKNDERK